MVVLFGCTPHRSWKPDPDHTANTPDDYGAGKKPG